MPIDPDVLSSLASDYAKPMTSIRGRRVQRLLMREFAGAEYLVVVHVDQVSKAVLGVSNSGAAVCVTDGTGNEAPVFRWSRGAALAHETRYDLRKDSLPELGTNSVPLAQLRAQEPLVAAALEVLE
jgi:hypothetical protein